MTRDAFKANVEGRLAEMGRSARSFSWLPGTARLLVVVNGDLREIPLKATMRKSALELQLGRLWGWAERLGLSGAGVSDGARTA